MQSIRSALFLQPHHLSSISPNCNPAKMLFDQKIPRRPKPLPSHLRHFTMHLSFPIAALSHTWSVCTRLPKLLLASRILVFSAGSGCDSAVLTEMFRKEDLAILNGQLLQLCSWKEVGQRVTALFLRATAVIKCSKLFSNSSPPAI